MFDLNADIARPKKLDVAAACGNFVGFAFIEKLVLLQARQRMVVLALEQRVRQKPGYHRLVGDLNSGHKEERLVAVHRIVVDQHDSFRAQLNRLDQRLQPGPFRLPVHARKDEIIPDVMLL